MANGHPSDNVTLENVDEVFKYHGPTSAQVQEYSTINTAAKEFARVVLEIAPECEDRKRCIDAIRDARMLANAAIALTPHT